MSRAAGQTSKELRTDSGIPVERGYRRADVTALDHDAEASRARRAVRRFAGQPAR